ncbi:hypothetical protein EYR38_008976 [Pleurotus pulmonarius]|nr:hypothetical protein EYR38_008976 [Pleurotus pulmonarius]
MPSLTSIIDPHKDGIGVWGGTETIIHGCHTSSKRAASSCTSDLAAERDIGGSHETGSPGREKTDAASLVDLAATTTDIPDTMVAVDYPGVEGTTAGERLFGTANESKVRISGAKPVVKFSVGDKGCLCVSDLLNGC